MPGVTSGGEGQGEAFGLLVDFLAGGRLTSVVAGLEHRLQSADADEVTRESAAEHIDEELLAAAVTLRKQIGRLNDLIHAAGICLALPAVMQPGERMANRPSLAAGNDPTRPFDVETDRRVAEFKFAVWTGADAMRKRGVFHDLVHLAADNSGRRAQLFVVGPQPIKFLRTSKSSAHWALTRGSDNTRSLFEARFGPTTMPIREFTSGPAAQVELLDLGTTMPALAAAVAAATT